MLLLACACGGTPRSGTASGNTAAQLPVGEAPPEGRLPKDVVPKAYTLEFSIVPEQAGFSGRTQIVVELEKPRQRIWLHGNQLQVSRASAEVAGATWPAHYKQVNDDGLASLTFRAPIPPGRAVLTLEYSADYDETLKGLYHVEAEGEHYAFTQFEPYSARSAFPSFDEPAFKTPFDVWVTIKDEHVAIANSAEVARAPVGDGYTRIQFARTLPLPTYLIALAVGPLEVVEAPPLAPNGVRERAVPFRGVAAKGKGEQLAYALSHTPALVTALEAYFATPYPFDKLDVIAVPDFAAGAMENAGAITFREWLLLLEPGRASEMQRRYFSYVMAHELAHQWFGNLVTMPWWDDLWLNEAFATWMGHKVVQQVWPDQQADLALLDEVHHAMGEDALVSARMIRQPIESTHDIVSAFDSITYRKGGGVLAMFERYLGEERFRAGLRLYMERHALGNATAEDLLAALSEASGEDITSAFSTFLMQSGVPEVLADTTCQPDGSAQVSLSQRRYLPVGSDGSRDQTWSIPLCLRYAGTGGQRYSQCTMLSEATGTVGLTGGCPTWLIPNADAAGYFLWSLPPEELDALGSRGFAQLTTRERMSLGRSLKAALSSGSVAAADALPVLARFTKAKERRVIEAPMSLLRFMHEHVLDEATRPALEAYARRLYRPVQRRLGLEPKPGEDGETQLLRASVLGFLADTGQDKRLRRRLAAMGRKYLGTRDKLRPEAVPKELAPLCVRVALQEGDPALFDKAYDHFTRSEDAAVRGILLSAMAAVQDPERSQKALALTLDPKLRLNEVTRPLAYQFGDPRTRPAAWAWLQANFDALAKRLSTRGMASTVHLSSGFCSKAHAEALQAMYEPHIEAMRGGPRHLAKAVEALQLCAARAAQLRPSTQAFFQGQAKP